MMINLIKDIKDNCKDHSIEGIVDFLNKSGDFSFTSEYHREIYLFYLEARKMPSTHREARNITIEMLKISSSTFKLVVKKFRDR